MPIPWPSELFPEAAVLGFAMAVAGSLVGAWIGARLNLTPTPSSAGMRRAAVLGAAVIAAGVGFALYKPADEGVRADVVLTDIATGANRTVQADVTMSPRDAADDAEWLMATAWQGDGLVVDELERVGPGRYRSTEPIPVHGNWKSLIRLHNGNSLTAIPVFLPEDTAIPAKEVPAQARFSREFIADHEILQREQKSTAAGLAVAAYLVVLMIALSLLGLLAWGLHRLGSPPPEKPARTERTKVRPATPSGAPAPAAELMLLAQHA